MGELYGEVNEYSNEWTDGLASKIMREFSNDDGNISNWCVFDGPVDALWIENMNTVLDDNMTLCLANGERIKLKPQMRMLFEVQDLSVASPATVSRCGMVYMTSSELSWRPYLQTWMQKTVSKLGMTEAQETFLVDQLFEAYFDMALEKMETVRQFEPITTYPIQTITCLCNFLEYYLVHVKVQATDKLEVWKRKLNFAFGFSFIWAIGGSFSLDAYKVLDNLFRDCFARLQIPMAGYATDYLVDLTQTPLKFSPWSKYVPEFEYDPTAAYFSLMVPTLDIVRYSYLLDILVQIKAPVFFTGETGVGKSVVIQKYISNSKEKRNFVPIFLNFSAQTSSRGAQASIEDKLEMRKGPAFLGATGNATSLIFVDDVNMPAVEEYGAQPCIELLR